MRDFLDLVQPSPLILILTLTLTLNRGPAL